MILKTIVREVEGLGIPKSTVAGIAQIAPPVYSRLRNGLQAPTDEQIRKIQRAADGLMKLVDLARPLPLDYSEVGTLIQLLKQLETGDLIIAVALGRQPEKS